jgi:hypothetical protein
MFQAVVGPPDEEGYCWVEIAEEGSVEAFSTHVIRFDQVRQWVEQELAILNDPRWGEECEHGLSAALCQGPMHY